MRLRAARLLLAAFVAAACLAPAIRPAIAQDQPAKVKPVAGRLFVVFFEEWSADLSKSALDVIVHAAQIAKDNPNDTVLVEGYADPTGSARANALVSALRSELVSDSLTRAGVNADRIKQVAYGSIDYVMNSQESRRVTIAIVPKQ